MNSKNKTILIPGVTGPIPVTDDSHPLMASWSLNLAEVDYVEEEFFVSGAANVYRWDANIAFYQWDASWKVEIVTPDFPYTTRILVRRPANPGLFSGNVIVEPIHTQAGGGDAVWAMCHDYFISHKDIWLGITQPASIATLKTFDFVRYGPLYGTNDAIIWDIISQVGALLKSKNNPLRGFKVECIYGTGYSQTCGLMISYINSVHDLAILDNGKTVFDGYVPAAIGVRPQTARNIIKPRSAPVILVLTQSEFLNACVTRRPDSDSPEDRYRRYEVPGATHVYERPLVCGASPDDMARLGISRSPLFDPGVPLPPNDFPLYYLLDGVFANLDRWVREGTPPPRAEPVSIIKNENQKMSIMLDDFGNAVGGVRTPYVDVPIVTYHTGYPEPGAGYKVPFVNALLKKLYHNHDGYVKQVIRATEKLIEDRWVTKSDGGKIIKEAECSNILVKC
jgi:hypothetical protein